MKAVINRRSSKSEPAATFYGSQATYVRVLSCALCMCMHKVGIKQHHTDATANLFQLVEGNPTDARVSVNNGQNKQSSSAEFATHCIVAYHQDLCPLIDC